MRIQLQHGDALLVADIQYDFLPGGSLGVPGSDAIIATVNAYIQLFVEAKLPVVASRDYHPENHISFRDQGGPWPVHCVAGSKGAEFHADLRLPASTIIISKGTSSEREAYSALDSTPLKALLREKAIKRVFVCGIATDYCVLASAKDLLQAGYRVVLLTDAVKAIDLQAGDGDKAIQTLTALGATTITLHNLQP